jgi:autotransporter-associated beta strand protein
MIATFRTTVQAGIRQRSLGARCRMGRATELVFVLATGVTLALAGAAKAQTVDVTGTLILDGTNVTVGITLVGGVVRAVSDTALSGTQLVVRANETGTVTADAGVTLTIDTDFIGREVGSTTTFGTAGVDGTVILGGPTGSGGFGTSSFVSSDSSVVVAGGTVVMGTAFVATGYLSSGVPNSRTTIDSGATVDLNGFDTEIGRLSGAGTITSGVAGTATLALTNLTGEDSTFSGGIEDGAGTVAVIKVGGGTLTLTGANSYSGDTTVNGGTLAITGSGSIASTGVTVNSGAVLSIDGGALSSVAGLTLNGTGNLTLVGSASIGSLASASGTSTVTLGANTLTIGGNGANTTFAGAISGLGGLTKEGIGTLTLSGANSYSGATLVDEGTLTISNGTALGTTAAGTTVADGATLALTGGISTGEAITLNGTGVSNGGALRNVSGSNTLAGAITVASASRINSDTGLLTISGTIDGINTSLTVGGAGNTTISGIVDLGSGGLTKDGIGTLTLTGANLYTGATVVTNGTLAITGPGAILSEVITVSGTGTLTTDGGALAAGADVTLSDTGVFNITNGESYDSLTQTGGTINGSGVHTLSGAFTQEGGTTGGTVTINAGSFTQDGGTIASGTVVSSAGAKTLEGGTIAGTLTGTGLTTVETGTTNLSGAITGGVVTIVTGGVLNLTGNSTVTDLRFAGGELTASADATLTGTAVGVRGAGQSGTISAANGVTLTLANTVFTRGIGGDGNTTTTFGSAGNGGTVAIATTNAGSVGSNSAVVIAEGTVRIGTAIAGAFAFDNVGGLRTGITTTVDATLDMNGFATTVANLGGTGDIVNNGAAGAVLTLETDQASEFSGVIADGTGAISVVKVQGGTQILSGTNTYSGTTTISAGTLQVGDGGTTGTLGSGDVINNAALVIDRSNALTLANAISGSGAVTITGGGTVTLSGANTFNGGLTVAEGTVALSGGAALADTGAVTVELGAILALIASERTGAVTNRGTLDLSLENDVAGTVLTVAGDYVGGDDDGASELVLDVVLGGDGSVADRLVVEGATSGVTEVFVVNQGGTGALTGTGILLIDVVGESGGAFSLGNADVLLAGDELGISAGSFVYMLRNVAGDWFLQSQLQSVFVAYEALPAALLEMTRAASLAQRLAGRQMLTAPRDQDAGLTASTSGAAIGSPATGAWLTLRAHEVEVTPEASATGLTYDTSTWRVQAGFDTILSRTAEGTWVVGASLFTGDGDLRATSALGAGSITTDARGLGLTATWYGRRLLFGHPAGIQPVHRRPHVRYGGGLGKRH